jgi:hypothetical protein
MSPKLIDEIVKIEVVLSAIPLLIAVLVYQFRWKWWKSAIGRHFMVFMSGLEMIMLLAVFNLFWPQMPGKPYIRIIVWAVIFILFTWRAYVMVFPNKYDDEEE